MNLTAEQLEQISTVLVYDDDGVSFWPRGKTEKDGYWYVVKRRSSRDAGIMEAGAADEKGDYSFTDRSKDSFLKFASENDLVASVAVDDEDGRYDHDQKFEDWEHLARFMGISDLVAVSTKIPKNVANRLRFYATRTSTVSDTVRQLIYDYVAKSMKDNAESDMFR